MCLLSHGVHVCGMHWEALCNSNPFLKTFLFLIPDRPDEQAGVTPV